MTRDSSSSARGSLASQLLDEVCDGVIAVTLDGRILSWNRGAATMLGQTAEDIVGRQLTELIVFDGFDPDSLSVLYRVLDEGSIVVGGVCRGAEGVPVPLDVSMRLVNGPNDDRFVAVVVRDATAMRRLHDLQASETRFRHLLEAAPDAMVIASSDGTMILVNAQTERLFGYKRQELIGQPVELLVPDRFHRAHRTHRSGYSIDPQPRGMGIGLELFGRRKDGTEFPVEISLSPLQADDQTLISSAIRDITERKQLEWRIQEASRLKGEFLANMSHELRTPLNAIIGFTELMYKGKAGSVSPEQHEYLGDILSSSRHLLQLINDVLDLAKVESGKVELRPQEVDLVGLTTEVGNILRGLAARKRLRMEIDVDEDVRSVVADAARLRQILYNYLSNAIKFTPEHGQITVRVVGQGPELFRIDVEDTGVGIPPEQLGRLFVEFQQLEAGMAKTYQGTGLGLALTKRITEAHGGRVAVRSTPGRGSTFSAILPRRPAPELEHLDPQRGGSTQDAPWPASQS